MHVFFSMHKVKRQQKEGSNIVIPTQDNFGEDFCEHFYAGVVRLTAGGVFLSSKHDCIIYNMQLPVGNLSRYEMQYL